MSATEGVGSQPISDLFWQGGEGGSANFWFFMTRGGGGGGEPIFDFFWLGGG